MRLINGVIAAVSGLGLTLLLASCAAPVNVVKTFDDADYANAAYSNVLVIVVAGSYENRARFERSMAAELSSSGISATAYYSVIGRNQPITRSDVSNAVQSRGFDSVLLTRILSQESSVTEKRGASTAQATRKDDGAIDLFRYDYEVFSNPNTINVDLLLFLSSWFAKYAKNPGYNGRTHTAPIGARSPAKNDNQRFVSAEIISTTCCYLVF